MAVPVLGGFPIFMVVRVLGFIIASLVLTWTVHYRGGLALSSDNKDHIFNVILFRLRLIYHVNDLDLLVENVKCSCCCV